MGRYWKSKFGKWTALGLMLLTLLIPGGIFAVGFILAGLAIGGIFAGVRSKNQGKGFMCGFSNYINGEWSQAIAITAILVIVTFGISTIARAAVAKAGSKTVLPNSVTEKAENTVRGMNNPNTRSAANMGNKVHYDELNGGVGQHLPTELSNRYTKTEFRFTSRGQAGADVEVIGGTHPSQYPGSTWNPGNNFGDFKPYTRSGRYTFNRDIRVGKLPSNTEYLPYDPITGFLR